MSWIIDQRHIWNFKYANVTDAQTDSLSAIDGETCFVFETKKSYYYEHWSTAVIDGLSVLSANWGAGRRIAQSPVEDNKQPDSFVLTATDITNWYVDLSQIPNQDKLIILTIQWLTNYDYTITTNRLTFWSSLNLEVWDEIDVTYYY